MYDLGMDGGRMKEIKIRVTKEQLERLRKVARNTYRSMTQQVNAYINQGLAEDEKEAS